MANPGRKIVLQTNANEIILADEYNTRDGRLHILGPQGSHYAIFDRERFSLEYRKASIDVDAVLYEADEWPDDALDRAHAGLVSYFKERL